ncbi:hypothetical protein WR25_23105 [Diploscapter pachys]|uniref:Uncharacterized protein n=1 Tax=Diploscapter pachys TaxID=2018661 RepID=A0A2A2LQF7_9BILA|nr:hypothetical protein WR25_23105 [Diploscapter pachys]
MVKTRAAKSKAKKIISLEHEFSEDSDDPDWKEELQDKKQKEGGKRQCRRRTRVCLPTRVSVAVYTRMTLFKTNNPLKASLEFMRW